MLKLCFKLLKRSQKFQQVRLLHHQNSINNLLYCIFKFININTLMEAFYLNRYVYLSDLDSVCNSQEAFLPRACPMERDRSC